LDSNIEIYSVAVYLTRGVSIPRCMANFPKKTTHPRRAAHKI
jgi:hypothetical protein